MGVHGTPSRATLPVAGEGPPGDPRELDGFLGDGLVDAQVRPASVRGKSSDPIASPTANAAHRFEVGFSSTSRDTRLNTSEPVNASPQLGAQPSVVIWTR